MYHKYTKTKLGSIRGRNILGHIRTAQLLDDMKDENLRRGTILNLDNLKAYNRVEHDYLWETLLVFGVNKSLVETMKCIYTNARTNIWLNK